MLSLIPYKQTYEALQKQDETELARLLSSFPRVSMQQAYRGFEHIEQKRAKKNIMKAHVYLDALLTLFRLPPQIMKSIDTLSDGPFKSLDVAALRAILEKFTEI